MPKTTESSSIWDFDNNKEAYGVGSPRKETILRVTHVNGIAVRTEFEKRRVYVKMTSDNIGTTELYIRLKTPIPTRVPLYKLGGVWAYDFHTQVSRLSFADGLAVAKGRIMEKDNDQ